MSRPPVRSTSAEHEGDTEKRRASPAAKAPEEVRGAAASSTTAKTSRTPRLRNSQGPMKMSSPLVVALLPLTLVPVRVKTLPVL